MTNPSVGPKQNAINYVTNHAKDVSFNDDAGRGTVKYHGKEVNIKTYSDKSLVGKFKNLIGLAFKVEIEVQKGEGKDVEKVYRYINKGSVEKHLVGQDLLDKGINNANRYKQDNSNDAARKAAIQDLSSAAEMGYTDAMVELSAILSINSDADGIKYANQWLQKAADAGTGDKGNLKAQALLGKKYVETAIESGDKKLHSKGMNYLNKSFDKEASALYASEKITNRFGDSDSTKVKTRKEMFNAAFEDGSIVLMLQHAAKDGSAFAAFRLGELSKGTEKDKALKYFQQASAKGYPGAADAGIALIGTTSRDIEKIQLASFYENRSGPGDKDAALKLYSAVYSNQFAPLDVRAEAAFKLARNSSEPKEQKAYYNEALKLINKDDGLYGHRPYNSMTYDIYVALKTLGKDVDADLTSIRHIDLEPNNYLIKAANAGHPEAEFEYATKLKNEERNDESILYLKQAAEHGNPLAQKTLIEHYDEKIWNTVVIGDDTVDLCNLENEKYKTYEALNNNTQKDQATSKWLESYQVFAAKPPSADAV